MADAKALFTQRFDAARTAFTKGDETAAAESLHSAIDAARSDPSLRRELASALFQLAKISRKSGRAGEDEAESLLTEALAISEGLFGREHAALAPVLNELGRLHFHRSQYARAGDVLERLLAIARVKGGENADVATALAGLAVVKRKLGDDAAAEALYRDALRIREKVLEPGHMVTVVTLEHLAETCAARGNFDEALALLRRALATREAAFGPGHASVQTAQSRVAELELQAAVADYAVVAAANKAARPEMATPAGLRRVPAAPAPIPSTILPSPVNSKRLEFLDEPERVLFPASLARAKTPTVTAAVAAASLMASSIQTPPPSRVVIPPENARPSGNVSSHESVVPHHDAVLAVAHSDVANEDAAVDEMQSTIAPVQADLAEEPARRKRMVMYASVGVAAVAIAALLFRPRPSGASDPVSTGTTAAQRTAAPRTPVVAAALTNTGPTAIGAAAVVGGTGAESLRSASARPAPTPPVVQPEKRAPESDPQEVRLPRVEVQLRPIKIPSVSVPSIATPSVDSIVRSAMERQRVSDSNRIGTAEKTSVPTSTDVERAEVDKPITPAKIIGRMPEPRFPDALRSRQREGQVVVRFIVDELGRADVASMIVEESDHPLFTAAVREILPRIRFEPARTRAPESKPVAGWVSIPFRFTTKR